MWSSRRRTRVVALASALALVLAFLGGLSAAGAITLPPLPIIGGGNGLNDLAALGQGTGQTPAKAPTVRRAEPPLLPTPVAKCGRGSKPEPGVDGRVPAGTGVKGLVVQHDPDRPSRYLRRLQGVPLRRRAGSRVRVL